MREPQTSPVPSSESPEHPAPTRPRAGTTAWVAFVFALIAIVLTWITGFAAPFAAQQAAARGDYDNLYTFSAIGWAIVVALNLVALILGIRGARQPTGKVLSGAAIALGATGILEFLVNVVISFQGIALLY